MMTNEDGLLDNRRVVGLCNYSVIVHASDLNDGAVLGVHALGVGIEGQRGRSGKQRGCANHGWCVLWVKWRISRGAAAAVDIALHGVVARLAFSLTCNSLP